MRAADRVHAAVTRAAKLHRARWEQAEKWLDDRQQLTDYGQKRLEETMVVADRRRVDVVYHEGPVCRALVRLDVWQGSPTRTTQVEVNT